MKKQSNIVFTALRTKHLADLTKEIKETIAFGLGTRKAKIFTVADLWNIQRHGKARVQRRYL